MSIMNVRKFARWITLGCGLCRLHIDIGTIIGREIDPACVEHEGLTVQDG